MPAPGAVPSTSAGLLVGLYAQVTISGISVLNLFDAEVRVRQTLTEVTAHGDEWEQWIPLRQGWTARARGYLTRAGAASTTFIGGSAKISASPAAMTFTMWSDMGTNVIFLGECFAEDISITRPNAMVEQEVTLRGSIAPNSGPAA